MMLKHDFTTTDRTRLDGCYDASDANAWRNKHSQNKRKY